jgi:hypothetical protein
LRYFSRHFLNLNLKMIFWVLILSSLPLIGGTPPLSHKRIWITTTEIESQEHKRFCTAVSTTILSNRSQLKYHLENKLKQRLRLHLKCLKIKSLIRSTENDYNDGDVFVRVHWRPVACLSAIGSRVVSLDVNETRHVRNDSKERIEIELTSSTSISSSSSSHQQQFISMDEVEKQLTALEADMIELKNRTIKKIYCASMDRIKFYYWFCSYEC